MFLHMILHITRPSQGGQLVSKTSGEVSITSGRANAGIV
jgi:hypothetical protein